MAADTTPMRDKSSAELMTLARHFLLRLQPDLANGRRVLDEIELRLSEAESRRT